MILDGSKWWQLAPWGPHSATVPAGTPPHPRPRSASIGPWRRSCKPPWSPGGPRCHPEALAGSEIPELKVPSWENPWTKWVIFQLAMFDI